LEPSNVVAKVPVIMTGATTTGALVLLTAVVSERTINEISCFPLPSETTNDEISCFWQMLFLLNVEDIRVWVHSFLRPHQFSRISSGVRENLLKGSKPLLYLI
jgi:hypothetical protein